jgi:hypothetical protein
MLLRCILAHLLVLHCRAFLISVGLLVLRSLFLLCQEIIVDCMFAIEDDAHFFESDLGGYSIVSKQRLQDAVVMIRTLWICEVHKHDLQQNNAAYDDIVLPGDLFQGHGVEIVEAGDCSLDEQILGADELWPDVI